MNVSNISYGLKDWIKENTLVVFLLWICIIVSIVVPRFLLPQNLINVMIQISINALLATGMTFVIITGGIDLAVGSVAALSGVIVTLVIKQMPGASIFICVLLGIILSIIVGGLCGGVSAFSISKLNVAPFIATLAMYSIARGFAYVITNSKPIFGLPDTFNWIGQGYVGFIPALVIFTVVIIIVSHIILEKTAYGRHIYAVGSNEEVARLSGVNISKIKSSVYIISGILSALGGFCLASKLSTGQPSAAGGYELTAIAAVVLGGTSMTGGKGGMKKTVIGIITIGVINNGLSLMQVSSYWQTITMGAIILFAVALDQVRKKNNV